MIKEGVVAFASLCIEVGCNLSRLYISWDPLLDIITFVINAMEVFLH